MFATDLDVVEVVSRPDFWRVRSPLIWLLATATVAALRCVTVPVDFLTDLASIPALLRGVMDVNGRSRRPAVLHDFLYAAQICTRAQADEILRLACIADGEPAAVARVYWLGVRLGGWRAWNDHKRKGMSSCFFSQDAYRAWLKAAFSRGLSPCV